MQHVGCVILNLCAMLWQVVYVILCCQLVLWLNELARFVIETHEKSMYLYCMCSRQIILRIVVMLIQYVIEASCANLTSFLHKIINNNVHFYLKCFSTADEVFLSTPLHWQTLAFLLSSSPLDQIKVYFSSDFYMVANKGHVFV